MTAIGASRPLPEFWCAARNTRSPRLLGGAPLRRWVPGAPRDRPRAPAQAHAATVPALGATVLTGSSSGPMGCRTGPSGTAASLRAVDQQATAFGADNGRSALMAGTALHAPKLPLAPPACRLVPPGNESLSLGIDHLVSDGERRLHHFTSRAECSGSGGRSCRDRTLF